MPDSVSLPLTCLTSNVPVVGSQTSGRNQPLVSTAPDHVYQNGTFSVSIAPAASNESSDLGSGATLKNVHDLHYKVNVPPNSSLLSFSISGGFGLGSGTPSVQQVGSAIQVNVPGPIFPGVNYQLPQINMSLRATGAALSTIQPRLAGTSYSDWGLQLTANADLPSGLGNADLPTACFPSSSTALATTTIWPTDTVGPAITITSPPDGATYAQGTPVTASFSCNDGPFGVGVASCNGTVASGNLVDTNTLGTRSFTVNASDTLGNTSSLTQTYTVVSDPGIVVRNGWATEGAGAQVGFKVSLTRAPTQNVSVHYATANGDATSTTDYFATSGDLTFVPGGPTTQTVLVTLRDDAVYEPTESFSLDLSAPVHGIVSIGTAKGRIRDTDQPLVRVVGGAATEASGAVVPMKVSLQGHTQIPVTVTYASGALAEPNPATASSDYTPVSGTLTFQPGGATVQTVNVPVINDTAWEADAERFNFTATNTANGQSASAPGTILDDEPHPPVISIGNVTVRESEATGTKQIWIPVTLDRAASTAVNVRWSTANGTATAPADYQALANQQLVLEAGTVSGVIKLYVNGDSLNEGNEYFKVNLFSPFGAALGAPTSTVTILDDDAPTANPATPVMSVEDVKVTEGDSGTSSVDATVSLNVKAPAKITALLRTYNSSAIAPGDYTTISKKVDLPEGRRHRPHLDQGQERPADRARRVPVDGALEHRRRDRRQDGRLVDDRRQRLPDPDDADRCRGVAEQDDARRDRGVVERRDDPARGLAADRIPVPLVDQRRHHLGRVDVHRIRHGHVVRQRVRTGRHLHVPGARREQEGRQRLDRAGGCDRSRRHDAGRDDDQLADPPGQPRHAEQHDDQRRRGLRGR